MHKVQPWVRVRNGFTSGSGSKKYQLARLHHDPQHDPIPTACHWQGCRPSSYLGTYGSWAPSDLWECPILFHAFSYCSRMPEHRPCADTHCAVYYQYSSPFSQGTSAVFELRVHPKFRMRSVCSQDMGTCVPRVRLIPGFVVIISKQNQLHRIAATTCLQIYA